jgi:hypothetical protein
MVKAQIRAMGDQSGQQGGEEMRHTGCLIVWTAKRVGETTPGINLHQEIFNADERQRALNSAAQLRDPGWEFEGIVAFQVQTVVADGRKRMARQAVCRPLGHRSERTLETCDKVVGLLGELEFGIG